MPVAARLPSGLDDGDGGHVLGAQGNDLDAPAPAALAPAPDFHGAPPALNQPDASGFPKAVSDSGADWVYVRFLPSKEQIEEARRVKKRVFIAGATVAGNLPKNWLHAATVGTDAILTDYPLEMRSVFRKEGK